MDIRALKKEAVIISEDASFHDAVAMMIGKRTNELLVVDDEGKLSGEVGITDLLNAIVPEYSEPENILVDLSTEDGFKKAVKDARNKLVSDFMTVDMQPVEVDDSLLTIASTALAHQTEHIPIVDSENRPIGLISRKGLRQILASYLDIKKPSQ